MQERTLDPIHDKIFGVPAVPEIISPQVVQPAIVLPKISFLDASLHRPVEQILDVLAENSEVEDGTSISTTDTCSTSV